MRNLLALFVWTIAAGLGSSSTLAHGEPPPPAGTAKSSVSKDKVVIYSGATLIDGNGGPARSDMAVVVDNDRIKAVLPVKELGRQFAGAQVRDVSKLYVLPGLVDSHVHLATPPDPKWAAALMRRGLYGGITAMRDMADDLRSVAELTRQSWVGEIPGPDIYYAAVMAGPSFFDDPRIAMVSQGGTAGKVPWAQSVDENTDMRAAVTLARGTYATAVKIYANLPPAMVKKIAEEAHRQGMAVWAHTTVVPTRPRDVVDAGADVVSHACLLGHQLSEVVPETYAKLRHSPIDPAPLIKGDNPKMAALFQDMRRRGVILDATLGVANDMAKELAKMPGAPKLYCPAELNVTLTAQAFREGVMISAGTDYNTPWQSAYPSLHEELEILADKVGMPSSAVIRAATSIGAKTIGRQDEMGTVEPGKLANLVFVSRDPLADVSNLRSVVFTVKRGVVFERGAYKPITVEEAGSHP